MSVLVLINERINGSSILPIPTISTQLRGKEMQTDKATALEMIRGLNEVFKSVVPAGMIAYRVVDIKTQSIVTEDMVLDTPENKIDMSMDLIMMGLMLPSHYLILTSLV